MASHQEYESDGTATSTCSFHTADSEDAVDRPPAPVLPPPSPPTQRSASSSDTLSVAETERAHARSLNRRTKTRERLKLLGQRRKERGVLKKVAAARIQAVARGFLVRRRVALMLALRAPGVRFTCIVCGCQQFLSRSQVGRLMRMHGHGPKHCHGCHIRSQGGTPKRIYSRCTWCGGQWLSYCHNRGARRQSCACTKTAVRLLQTAQRRRRLRRMCTRLWEEGRARLLVKREVAGVMNALIDSVVVNERRRLEFEEFVAYLDAQERSSRGINVQAPLFVPQPRPRFPRAPMPYFPPPWLGLPLPLPPGLLLVRPPPPPMPMPMPWPVLPPVQQGGFDVAAQEWPPLQYEASVGRC